MKKIKIGKSIFSTSDHFFVTIFSWPLLRRGVTFLSVIVQGIVRISGWGVVGVSGWGVVRVSGWGLGGVSGWDLVGGNGWDLTIVETCFHQP